MADFNRVETAGNIVNRVLSSLGLPTYASPSAATDKTCQQMWNLLTECGQDLISEYNWQALIRTQTITTDSGTEYALPEDWERYIDSTGWNNTGRLPLIGPLNPQQWRMLQARQLGGTTLRLQYVIRDSQIELYFAPTPSQTLQIDYISRGWVQDASDTTVYRDHPENDADKVLYRPRLMITYLKYRWRQAKGFEATDAEKEYKDALAAAKYADAPKSDLQLNSRAGFPYLNYNNMPDTRYGNP